MIKKIILVFKTHFDIGFTDLAERVIRGYGSDMLREVISTCNATGDLGKLRYVWTMPAWPLWHICSHCDPELKPELDRLIAQGQIVWHSLPFTTHTDFSVPDEYMQSLRFSRELAEKYGKPIPVSAKMTDVPGHGLMLPELLSEAGIRFLHLGCNEFATPPQVPDLFFWQSPAGNRVLTMYSRGGYGTGLLPPKDWEYPVWMALMHTHDNCGPQSADLIRAMAEKARAAYPEAEIICGTMDDFYYEMEKCDLSRIPVVTGDLADTWIHGVGSYPAEVSMIRACRERAKRLHGASFEAISRGETLDPALEALWKDYYETTALFSEHTWGADVKTWLGPDRVYEKEEFLAAKASQRCRFMEASWAEQSARAKRASALLDQIEAIISPAPLNKPDAAALETEQDGDILAVTGGRYTLRFSVHDGRILSLRDNRLDAELLAAGEEGVLSYRYDRCGLPDITEFLRSYGYHFTTWGIQDYGRENYPDCDHETYRPAFTGYTLAEHTLTLRYAPDSSVRDYGDAEQIRLILTFRQEDIAAELCLDGKQATPYVEFGSLVLPFAGKASCRIGKPGGVVNPETDIADCANHAMFNLEREVTILGEKAGISICSMDAPLFGIGSPGVYEYHRQYGPERPATLYFNLFKNMWGTNFPQWISGSFSYRFVLRGVTKEEAERAPVWAAELTRGTTSGIPAGMELTRTSVEDGKTYVALRDLTGRERTAAFTVPGGLLTPVDLFLRPLGEERETAEFTVAPYGTHQFALRRMR